MAVETDFQALQRSPSYRILYTIRSVVGVAMQVVRQRTSSR